MVASPLNKLFGRSPIRPIQLHMAKATECAQTLNEFFDAVNEADWKKARAARSKIKSLEQKADTIKKDIRANLPNTLFMPVARTDLLELLRMQDEIANVARDICGLMIGRKMLLPEQIAEMMLEFVNGSTATCEQALKVIEELDELFEASFSGPERKIVESLIEALEDLEKQVDKQEVKIRAALFAIESKLPAVEVMFLYKIIELIGTLSDRAQRVGSRLELLTAR